MAVPATDGKTFDQIPLEEQALFRAQYGASAEAAWVQQHNESLRNQSGFTTNLPGVGGVNLPADTPAELIQLYFNNALLIANAATANLSNQGISPEMAWDSVKGGFVPTGRTAPTLNAIRQRYDINRAQIDQFARLWYQSGRAPRTKLGEDGLIRVITDEGGMPIFDETLESKGLRLNAGQAVGFVSNDLMQSPTEGQNEPAGEVTPGDEFEPGKLGVGNTNVGGDASGSTGAATGAGANDGSAPGEVSQTGEVSPEGYIVQEVQEYDDPNVGKKMRKKVWKDPSTGETWETFEEVGPMYEESPEGYQARNVQTYDEDGQTVTKKTWYDPRNPDTAPWDTFDKVEAAGTDDLTTQESLPEKWLREATNPGA